MVLGNVAATLILILKALGTLSWPQTVVMLGLILVMGLMAMMVIRAWQQGRRFRLGSWDRRDRP